MPSGKVTCRILGTPQEFPIAAKASRDGHRRYNCPHADCKSFSKVNSMTDTFECQVCGQRVGYRERHTLDDCRAYQCSKKGGAP
jgi:transcription elongation factor Elf1